METTKDLILTSWIPSKKGQEITSLKELVKTQCNDLTKLKSAGFIRKNHPEYYEEVVIKIHSLILDVFTFYNEQIIEENLIPMIQQVEEIGRYLTGADIDIFKNNCRAGIYPLKFRLTPPVFIEWLKQYIYDRGEEFANANHMVKKQHESVPLHPQAVEKISEIFKPKESEPKPEVEQKFDPVRKLVNIFKRDFDEGCLTEKTAENSTVFIQFIEYEGKKLGINEYLAARFENFYNEITAEYSTAETDLRFNDYFNQVVNNITIKK